jgi:hypothetical protein
MTMGGDQGTLVARQQLPTDRVVLVGTIGRRDQRADIDGQHLIAPESLGQHLISLGRAATGSRTTHGGKGQPGRAAASMAFHQGPNLARTWYYRPASSAAEPLLHAGLSWTPPREPLAGPTVHTPSGTPGHFQARFPQVTYMSRRCELGRFPALFRLTSEGSLVRTQLSPPFHSIFSEIFS